MTYDVIVVGAGLAGLFAGAMAARRGAKTLVIGRGVGATHIGTGTIDVLGYDDQKQLIDSPAQALPRFVRSRPGHPYALAGIEALGQAVAALSELCQAAGYPLAGDMSRNFHLPTAAGAVRPTCLAPQSMKGGEVRLPEKMAIVDLPGVRDFYAPFVADNLRAQLPPEMVETRRASLPEAPQRREAYATDLARLLDGGAYRAKAAKTWKGELSGVARAGFPAILGLDHAAAAYTDLREALQAEVFEIPLLPPSVPGMRLHNILVDALKGAGGDLILGPRVMGRVAGRGDVPRAAGITAETASGWKAYDAASVILASGGFLGGGLRGEQAGRVLETVFDLPVVQSEGSHGWFEARLTDNHPYQQFGVRVDESMRVIGADGAPIYSNLYAAGAVLAGADRLAEGSREGISLATAHKAVACLDLAS